MPPFEKSEMSLTPTRPPLIGKQNCPWISWFQNGSTLIQMPWSWRKIVTSLVHWEVEWYAPGRIYVRLPVDPSASRHCKHAGPTHRDHLCWWGNHHFRVVPPHSVPIGRGIPGEPWSHRTTPALVKTILGSTEKDGSTDLGRHGHGNARVSIRLL